MSIILQFYFKSQCVKVKKTQTTDDIFLDSPVTGHLKITITRTIKSGENNAK